MIDAARIGTTEVIHDERRVRYTFKNLIVSSSGDLSGPNVQYTFKKELVWPL